MSKRIWATISDDLYESVEKKRKFLKIKKVGDVVDQALTIWVGLPVVTPSVGVQVGPEVESMVEPVGEVV